MKRIDKMLMVSGQVKNLFFFVPRSQALETPLVFSQTRALNAEQDTSVFSVVLSCALLCSPDLEISGRRNPLVSSRTRAGANR